MTLFPFGEHDVLGNPDYRGTNPAAAAYRRSRSSSRAPKLAEESALTVRCRRLAVSRRRLTLNRLLHLAGQLRESQLVFHGHLREHLAIQFNAERLQSVDELAVSKLVGAGGGADAKDPEPAEIALAATPVAEGITASLIRGFLHRAVELAFGEEIAFGELGELFPIGATHSAALNSRHGFLLFERIQKSGVRRLESGVRIN